MAEQPSLWATAMHEPMISLPETWLFSQKTQGEYLYLIFDQPRMRMLTVIHRHYIENTGTEDLIWIEIFKSDRVEDISVTQWLALTPADLVAQVLKVPVEFAEKLKKGKQIFA